MWLMIGVVGILLWSAFAEPTGVRRTGTGLPHLDARVQRLPVPGADEQISMMTDKGLVGLFMGYHKMANVYVGTTVVPTLFGTGSCRICIDGVVLSTLEGKQRRGDLGDEVVISPRASCGSHNADGAVGESITCYSEVVEILLTF